MLRELFDRVLELAEKTVRPTVLKPADEPPHKYLIAHPDGSLTSHEAEAQPRRHTAGSLLTLVDFAQEFHTEGQTKVVIWYNRDGVVCFLDDETRRETVTMPLKPSSQMLVLKALAQSRNALGQADFIRLLRIDLAGTLHGNDLIAALRRLKFRVNQAGERVVEHGRSSIGKSLDAELTGATSIPEEVSLFAPAWDGQPYACSVRCALEVQVEAEKFQLVPLPGQIEEAVAYCEGKLRQGLEQHLADAALTGHVPVYYGKP